MGQAGACGHRKAVRAALSLGLLAQLAACDAATSPDQQASDDAAAVARVVAAQDDRPPVAAITLLPIQADDLDRFGAGSLGCRLLAAGTGRFIVIAGPRRAVIRTERTAVALASDPGSAAMPLGTWAHYVGKNFSVTLARQAGSGAAPGADALEWPARVTVRDAWDRIVYTGAGTLSCGA